MSDRKDNNLNSIITTSREKAHISLSNLFKSQFGQNVNLDKTGFNAWVIEAMTDSFRNIALSLALNKEENFLNTCKSIATARRIGREYGFDKLNVNPARGVLSVTLLLPYDFKNDKIFINADETTIYAGDVQYMLPGNIEIVSDANGFIQTVRRTNHIFETSDNVILTSEYRYDDENKLLLYSFATECMQVSFIDSSVLIEDHMQMTNSQNEIEFDDNFYKIVVWYENYNAVTNNIDKIYLTEVDDFASHNSFADVFKVEVSDSNKITFITGNGINGKYYAAGKELKYRLFTTKGKAGNTVNAALDVSLQTDLNSIRAVSEFLSNPINGRDEYTLIELKDAIRKKIQTADTIITNTDLKNSLSDILGLASEETFHKLRRNDPIERILDLFIIVKDQSNSDVSLVIPTNTMDVEVDTDYIIDNKFNTIKPFFSVESTVVNEDGVGDIRVNKVVPPQKAKNPNSSYYSSYYAIKIQKNPLMCNFFNFNSNYSLSYENTYTNKDLLDEVYINNVVIERNTFNLSNQYFIRITLDSVNMQFLKDNTLIVKARFFNTVPEEDFILDFVRVVNEDGTLSSNQYEAKVTSLDVISDSNNLFIKDVFKLSRKFTDGTEEWTINTEDYKTDIQEKLDCEISIFFNYDSDEVVPSKSFQNVRSVRKKLLMTTYKVSNVSFYQNVDEIIYCQVERVKGNTIKIKSLPLYKEEYIKSVQNVDTLTKQMSIEKNIKEKINERTEFPSRISLKYFNTYGYSDSYSSLENVSLVLNFEVSYKNNKVISNSELDDIKNNLIKFIDSINKKDITEDKNIYVSDLLQILRSNANIIQCRLLNFNDNIYFNKSILRGNDFIPSSLQLDKENIIFTVKSI